MTVDYSKLSIGLYSTQIPKLYSEQNTIETLIHDIETIKYINVHRYFQIDYDKIISHLQKCKLVEVELTEL